MSEPDTNPLDNQTFIKVYQSLSMMAADISADIQGISGAIDAAGDKIESALAGGIGGGGGLDAGEIISALSTVLDPQWQHNAWVREKSGPLLDALLKMLAAAGPGAADALAKTLGEAPPWDHQSQATVGGAVSGSMQKMAGWMLSAAGPGKETIDAAIANNGKLAEEMFAGGLGRGQGLTRQMMGYITERFRSTGHVGPEGVLTRAFAALAPAAAMGLAAHLIATGLSTEVLACLNLNATGVAAMFAEFAGYKEILGPLHSVFHNANIATPWKYQVNEWLTPYLPDPGTLLGWYAERHLTDPVKLKKWLAQHGYDETWADLMIETSRHRLGMRELRTMTSLRLKPKEWWTDQLEHQGYKDAVIEDVYDAILQRDVDPWRNQIVDYAMVGYEKGRLDKTQLLSVLQGMRVLPTTRPTVLEYADARRTGAAWQKQIDWALLQYDQVQIGDDDLDQWLGLLIRDDQLRALTSLTAKLKRKVKLHKAGTYPALKDALAKHRTLYLTGRETEFDYRRAMLMAEMDLEAIELTMLVDSKTRDETIVADLRQYNLPLLRDLVVHEALSEPDYRLRLQALAMPEPYLSIEVAWVTRLRRYKREAIVQADMLADARAAYVAGLIDRRTLTSYMTDAGYIAATVETQLRILDPARAAQLEKLAAAIVKQMEKADVDERRRLITELAALDARFRTATPYTPPFTMP